MIYVLTLKSLSSVALDTYLHSTPELRSPVYVFQATIGQHPLQELSKGEVGVRQSFVNMFEDALEKRVRTIVIFEDDVNFIVNFGEAFRNLMQNDQCSCFLDSRTGCHPGMLLLGSTPWGENDLVCMDDEFAATEGLCVEHQPHTFGAFAVVMNTDVLPALLKMIRLTAMPLDWYWSELAKAGYVVRVAYPFLNIPNVAKPSSVRDRNGAATPEELREIARERMVKHGWDRFTYIDPASGEPFHF